MVDVNYFYSFGIFWLIVLTYQDLKKGKVDSRYNWFMSGIVGSMIALKHPDLLHVMVFIGVTVLFSMIISKAVGKGDLTGLSWIILGFGMIKPSMVVVFFCFFISYSLIHYSIRILTMIHGKVAFYPVIFSSFLCVVIVYF